MSQTNNHYKPREDFINNKQTCLRPIPSKIAETIRTFIVRTQNHFSWRRSMKEFKLRVWDKVRHKMFRPLAITFDTQSLAPFAITVPGRSWEPVHKYVISYSTGLTDQSGTEVYQGDLLTISSEIYLVIWNEENACFELQDVKSSNRRIISDVARGEITGNQFENPEIIHLNQRIATS